MNAVFSARAVGGEIGAFGGEPPQLLGVGVGLPHARQKIGVQQLGEHPRVHFIGFDLGFGDGARAQRIADHHFFYQRAQQIHDGPGVEGSLHGDRRLTQMPARELLQRRALCRQTLAVHQRPIFVQHGGFDLALVQIQSRKLHILLNTPFFGREPERNRTLQQARL
ncbi:MAG TPA: hypothetical protein VH639_12710 [Bryobacteraceae bacterium]